MSTAFLACLGTLFLLAAIGAPIAYATIVSAVVYLFMTGQDLGLAGEQVATVVADIEVLVAQTPQAAVYQPGGIL